MPFETLAEATSLDGISYWTAFQTALLAQSSALDQHTKTIRACLTDERIAQSAEVRAALHSEADLAWLRAKKRSTKPIRVYRIASLGSLSGGVWYTNVDAAAVSAETYLRPHLVVGEVHIAKVIMRLGDLKMVIARAEDVRVLQCMEMTKVTENDVVSREAA